MMAGWLVTIPAALGAWSVRLLDVSWQAGLLAAAAWVACRVFPRMPAHVRAMLWWLVCAKFLIGLAWTQPIALPLLPAESAGKIAANAGLTDDGAGSGAAAGAGSGRRASGGTSRFETGASTAAGWASLSSSPTVSMPLALGVIWICGTLLQLALTYLAYRRTRALVRDSTPADVSIARLSDDLCERIARIGSGDRISRVGRIGRAGRIGSSGGIGDGIRHVDVRTSAAIDTPRVTGAFSPIILLPATADRLSHADLEMTLCHELLHIHRGDLILGWLPSLAQCVFFFHPFMWIATREYALAREAACDAAVLRVLGAEPDVYGALLLRLGIAHTDIAPVAVGASSSFRTLKRRLLMLQHASEKARAHAARWWILAAAAGLLIVPLRLVAQSPAPAQTTALAATTTTPEMKLAPTQAPEHDPWTALKSETWRAAQKLYNSTRDAWVLLREGDEDDVSMSGRSDDIPEARRQRERAGEGLLWFRHNGRAYVIRDPATLHSVQELFEPMNQLGDQQGALGAEQGKLGDQQGKLGDQQGVLGEEMSKLARQLNLLNADQLELAAKQIRNGDAERARVKEQEARIDSEMKRINAQMESLGRRQEELGHQQEALGREQEKFGRQQEALGRQQEEVAKRAERQIQEIMERAIATGLAKPAR